ncbi:hypothetical protein C1645_826597 [Glomus cerebriforme]|uniref:Uncharacterized protein n=1 Tax=Glomus cerebriforme TaxID=658196 RepID=A0A397SZQ4_9GLOM|nr:hypothetical protein C1645_826597 [Glomus cerebriforme]
MQKSILKKYNFWVELQQGSGTNNAAHLVKRISKHTVIKNSHLKTSSVSTSTNNTNDSSLILPIIILDDKST